MAGASTVTRAMIGALAAFGLAQGQARAEASSPHAPMADPDPALPAMMAPQGPAPSPQPVQVTFTLGVDTVGVLRGRRSRDLNPPVSAVVEATRGLLYGGLVLTPTLIQGQKRPLVLGYVGAKPAFAGLKWNLGARYYAFPHSNPFRLDLDGDGLIDFTGRKGFAEGFVGAKRLIGPVELSARAFHTSEDFGQSGTSLYATVGVEAPLWRDLIFKAHGGRNRSADKRINENTWDYAAGVYGAIEGFDVFARYSDRAGMNDGDNAAFVFGIERTFTVFRSKGRAPADDPNADHRRPDDFARARAMFAVGE